MGSDVTSATRKRNSSADDSSGKGGKFLTFFLAGEEYGLEILKVHEIIGMMPITSVPRTPQYIRGVINLRGKVIPVVDLRLKLAMDETAQTDETCIIVVQASGLETGVIVDKVSEVLDIVDGEIDETPSFGTSVNSDYILGIGKSDGRVKLLLDIDRVLTANEADVMGAVTAVGGEMLALETDEAGLQDQQSLIESVEEPIKRAA